MKSFAEIDIENNGNYLKLLSAVSKISGLFSESAIPFINYRVAENIFCRSFKADNLSRSDTAFDANFNSVGIGLKTFILKTDQSSEKIAEFNSLSRELMNYKGKELALKLSEFRNERINLANRVYDINSSLYHIVARRENELLLFETDYNLIDLNNINSVKTNKASLQFEDGKNFYSFNFSKSTLFRKFSIPKNAFSLPIEILEDPYELLLDLLRNNKYDISNDKLVKGKNYVILPLYSTKLKPKQIPERSGINQWNSKPRPNQKRRGFGEIEMRIPKIIHDRYPNFFPKKDFIFYLEIPNGKRFEAKVCQQNRKALMTNPNKAISDWLLRKVLKLEEGELATIDKLNKLGVDSLIIIKESNVKFKIDIMKTGSYENFINNQFHFF